MQQQLLTCFYLELDLDEAVALECGQLGPQDLLVKLEQVTEIVLPHTGVAHQHVCTERVFFSVSDPHKFLCGSGSRIPRMSILIQIPDPGKILPVIYIRNLMLH